MTEFSAATGCAEDEEINGEADAGSSAVSLTAGEDVDVVVDVDVDVDVDVLVLVLVLALEDSRFVFAGETARAAAEDGAPVVVVVVVVDVDDDDGDDDSGTTVVVVVPNLEGRLGRPRRARVGLDEDVETLASDDVMALRFVVVLGVREVVMRLEVNRLPLGRVGRGRRVVPVEVDDASSVEPDDAGAALDAVSLLVSVAAAEAFAFASFPNN